MQAGQSSRPGELGRSTLDETLQSLAPEAGAQVVLIDYLDEESIAQAAQTLGSERKLDVLVNCGGVNTKPSLWDGGKTAESVTDKFKIMALRSYIGKVLSISPDLASIADKDAGRIRDRMAKTCLNQQTASLAVDFKAQGINVDLGAVHPGRVPTRTSGGNDSVDLDESAAGMVKIVEESPMRILAASWTILEM